ncbi:putative zinc- or iron-chelating protein [Luteibacter sp. OK325]|uniref:YkgJ family cysteine cluster protein n=1 Tax=Luteibacter sp. OK325 TaxID=2135670 RepID=UPI000D3B9E03|nr:YkgJ family cysteine cluster protein [Luteibacter sp. OK325]PTR34341.1 putative zinc- or iron-chelating protein [Luteibacter sp. OK325]
MCGRCCHGLRLPLGLAEARNWLGEGGDVELFCEAIPWPQEMPADDGVAQHKRNRSFAAASGTLPVRVIVSLLATFEGACPNLRSDMSCGIYERRPMACRIYPAEVNPFLSVDPAQKLCPPEAWTTGTVLQTDEGRWADTTVAEAVDSRRGSDYREADAKGRLCELLGIVEAGLTNEGVVTHTPERSHFLAALDAVSVDALPGTSQPDWVLVSHRERTLALLDSAGASLMNAGALTKSDKRFIAFVE